MVRSTYIVMNKMIGGEEERESVSERNREREREREKKRERFQLSSLVLLQL